MEHLQNELIEDDQKYEKLRDIDFEKSRMKKKVFIDNFLCMTIFSLYFTGNYLLNRGTYG